MFKYCKRRRYIFVLLLLFSINALFAQIPNGYYNAAYNKSEYALKTALHQIIKQNHQQSSYGELWEHFKTTDRRADGKVWDMYSNCSFTFGGDQCGNYNSVCDCYNREHSFPKSWFNDAYPMYTDLFQLYPTDGYVNGVRGNLPFGETNGGSFGTGKRGSCTFPGYSGTVFEPADEYKGDFARTYFYMATRYQDIISGWNAEILNGNNSSVFVGWTINLLLKWAKQDTVSQKEIDRNNAVYHIQKNRNPFIDYPELAGLIWGDEFGNAFNPNGTMAPIFGEESVCEESAHIYKTEKDGSNYLWTVRGGAIQGATNRDSVVILWSRSGTGEVFVEYNETGKKFDGNLTIEIKQRPSPTIIGDRQVLINSTGHQYDTESGMSAYIWSFTGNISLSEGGKENDAFAVLDFGGEGTTTVSINYNKNGCEALQPTTIKVEIVHEIGIDDFVSWEKNITVAPNPATHFVYINFMEHFTGTVQMINLFGNVVHDLSISTSTTQTIDLSTYNNGIYLLRISPENSSPVYKKIIIIK